MLQSKDKVQYKNKYLLYGLVGEFYVRWYFIFLPMDLLLLYSVVLKILICWHSSKYYERIYYVVSQQWDRNLDTWVFTSFQFDDHCTLILVKSNECCDCDFRCGVGQGVTSDEFRVMIRASSRSTRRWQTRRCRPAAEAEWSEAPRSSGPPPRVQRPPALWRRNHPC